MAEAKGLSQRWVMLTYTARNAILPSITGFAMSLGFIVGGSLLTIFSTKGEYTYMSSEIRRLKQEIEQRCQAVKLCLNGYAEVAKHQTIEHKYKALGDSWQELEQFVGAESANEIVTSAYMSVMAEETGN